MRGVRVVILQFEDAVSGQPPMTPFLAVIEDQPEWLHLLAWAHGTIPSRVHVMDLVGENRSVHDHREPARLNVLRTGGWKVPLECLQLDRLEVTP